MLSPQTRHGQPFASAGDGLNASPPAPIADMARATRPTKLRRVRRLPARRADFSASWSKDMPVHLPHRPDLGTCLSSSTGGFAIRSSAWASISSMLSRVFTPPDTMTLPASSVTTAHGAPGTLAATLAVSAT